MKKLIITILAYICFFSNNCSFAVNEETLIIFDASVSMLDMFSGKPKYILAVEEAKNAIDSMSDTSYIGLRTIGVSIDAAILSLIQNPDELCKATRLVSPISQNNKDSIKSNLDSVFPLGTTPLTYTLDLAINYDFSKLSYKHIILITDGAESCNGNPCQYIRRIMQSRSDIKIDIIAIGVNSNDFEQLKCLTDATSGTIFNIKNQPEMKDAFKVILNPKYNKNINNTVKDTENSKNVTYKNYMIETYY